MSAAPTGHPKLIYFAARPPGLDPVGFRARWRQHARLGMSMPRWCNIQRYVHCDSVELVGTALPIAWCDGVAMVWYRSEESRLAHISDRSAAPVMKRDERETFARPVREASLLAEEHVLRACKPARYKLFLRLRARPDRSGPAFRDWWLGVMGPGLLQRLDAVDACRGYVQSHARAPDAGRGIPAPLCDCVDELACDHPERVDAALSAAIAGAAEHLAEVKAIWTEETVLYSR